MLISALFSMSSIEFTQPANSSLSMHATLLASIFRFQTLQYGNFARVDAA
jgi:hypothetical protein